MFESNHLYHELCVDEEDAANPEVPVAQLIHEHAHHRNVRVQLDLTLTCTKSNEGHAKDEVHSLIDLTFKHSKSVTQQEESLQLDLNRKPQFTGSHHLPR